MTDTTQGNLIERTPTGEIAEPGSQPTTTPTTTPPATDTTTETKPEADKPLLTEKPEDTKPEGAPEKYAAYTLPEGLALDDKVVEEFNTLAKASNLSQAQAQSLVDFHVKTISAAQDAPLQVWKDKQAEWRSEIIADPKFGNGKDDLKPDVKASIGRLLKSLGPLEADFRQFMDYSGAANNPAMIRTLHSLASRLTEGRPVLGNGPTIPGQTRPGTRPASAAQAMFPNLPSAG